MKQLTRDTKIRLTQIDWSPLTQDKHSNYKIGEVAEWKDGTHRKTAHGWVKVKEERDRYKEPIGEIKNLNKLTEKYFMRPESSLKLPAITSKIWQEKMHDNRPVLLKKFVVERMKNKHHEIKDQGLNHRDIVLNAIYNCDKILYCKPESFPYYYTAVKKSNGGTPVKIETKNCVAVLDISPENKYIEIVDWRWISDKKENKLEKKNQMQ